MFLLAELRRVYRGSSMPHFACRQDIVGCSILVPAPYTPLTDFVAPTHKIYRVLLAFLKIDIVGEIRKRRHK